MEAKSSEITLNFHETLDIVTHIGASPNAPMCSGQRTYVKMPTHIRVFTGAILSAVYAGHL